MVKQCIIADFPVRFTIVTVLIINYINQLEFSKRIVVENYIAYLLKIYKHIATAKQRVVAILFQSTDS